MLDDEPATKEALRYALQDLDKHGFFKYAIWDIEKQDTK